MTQLPHRTQPNRAKLALLWCLWHHMRNLCMSILKNVEVRMMNEGRALRTILYSLFSILRLEIA
jgi:hypothetical protein